MTPSPASLGAPALVVRPGDEHAPTRLSHLAFVTPDSAATTEFYTKVMRMQLAAAVVHERIPSTGETMPYLHTFFRMQDGSTIAFFEAAGLPGRVTPSHPAYHTFDHIALEVATTDEVDEWKEHLLQHGVEVLGPIDHTIVYSIYFRDPNGFRLEITTPLEPDWNDRPEAARELVDAWIAAKEQARASGADETAALYDVVSIYRPSTDET